LYENAVSGACQFEIAFKIPQLDVFCGHVRLVKGDDARCAHPLLEEEADVELEDPVV
jgi:hypothetical protein